jgi:hypothetical protein
MPDFRKSLRHIYFGKCCIVVLGLLGSTVLLMNLKS